MREDVVSTIFPEDDWTFSPRAHLTVEAPHTGLSHNAVELRLLWVLAADVTDLGLGIIRDETRLLQRYRTTALHNVCVCV